MRITLLNDDLIAIKYIPEKLAPVLVPPGGPDRSVDYQEQQFQYPIKAFDPIRRHVLGILLLR